MHMSSVSEEFWVVTRLCYFSQCIHTVLNTLIKRYYSSPSHSCRSWQDVSPLNQRMYVCQIFVFYSIYLVLLNAIAKTKKRIRNINSETVYFQDSIL